MRARARASACPNLFLRVRHRVILGRDGAWIAIADAAGRGPQAGGLGSVALAALRAARRNDATLEQAVQTMHETMCDVGGPEFFLTAIVARWHPVY